jgi:hypothetical protein
MCVIKCLNKELLLSFVFIDLSCDGFFLLLEILMIF